MLQAYADRGVFRAFGEKTGRGGTVEFTFRWLTEIPLTLLYDPRRRTLAFRNLLPGVPARSAMRGELIAFLKERTGGALPEHRRIDARRAELRWPIRGGNVSLVLRIKGKNEEYATRRGVNLVNEIFNGFLTGPYYEYLVEHFRLREE